MNNGIVIPTKGPYWVRPTLTPTHGFLTITSKELAVIAIVPPDDDGTPNYVNAGTLAANPHLIEALVDIQMRINSKEPVTTAEINLIIANAFEKIYIEADV